MLFHQIRVPPPRHPPAFPPVSPVLGPRPTLGLSDPGMGRSHLLLHESGIGDGFFRTRQLLPRPKALTWQGRRFDLRGCGVSASSSGVGSRDEGRRSGCSPFATMAAPRAREGWIDAQSSSLAGPEASLRTHASECVRRFALRRWLRIRWDLDGPILGCSQLVRPTRWGGAGQGTVQVRQSSARYDEIFFFLLSNPGSYGRTTFACRRKAGARGAPWMLPCASSRSRDRYPHRNLPSCPVSPWARPLRRTLVVQGIVDAAAYLPRQNESLLPRTEEDVPSLPPVDPHRSGSDAPTSSAAHLRCWFLRRCAASSEASRRPRAAGNPMRSPRGDFETQHVNPSPDTSPLGTPPRSTVSPPSPSIPPFVLFPSRIPPPLPPIPLRSLSVPEPPRFALSPCPRPFVGGSKRLPFPLFPSPPATTSAT